MCCCYIPGMMMIKSLKPSAYTESYYSTSEKSGSEPIKTLTLRECLQSRYFLTIIGLCLCLYMPGSFLALNQKSFLLSRINNDFIASWLATMGCVLLICGRLVSGWLFDKFKIIGLLRFFIFIVLFGHIIIIT